MKHLSHDQIDALIAAAESDRDRLLFQLCYEHGLRISECLALTRAHVQRDFLTIKAKKRGKRSDERLSAATTRLWGIIDVDARAKHANISLQSAVGISDLPQSR
jgi:integrase